MGDGGAANVGDAMAVFLGEMARMTSNVFPPATTASNPKALNAGRLTQRAPSVSIAVKIAHRIR